MGPVRGVRSVMKAVSAFPLVNGAFTHAVAQRQSCSGLGLVAHKPPARLDSQIELQLFVDAVHTLVIPLKASHAVLIQVTQAKAPVAVVVSQTQQPVGQLGVICVLFALVSIALLAGAKRLAGHPYARTALAHCSFGHRSPVRWPHRFFSSADSRLRAPSCAASSIVYAAVLGAPLVERCRAYTQLSANIGHRKARFNPFDRINDACQ